MTPSPTRPAAPPPRPAAGGAGPPGRRAWPLALCLLALAAAGCPPPPARETPAAENRRLRDQNARLQADLQAARQQAADRQKHVEALQALGDRRLDRLFHVTGIELGRYSGGVDIDGRDGDDAVRVYLQPTDRNGDTLKAAGAVTIRLFDLAAPGGENLLGEYHGPVERIGQHWAGGFMTRHYRFDCPFTSGPPRHGEVTIRAEFTDYLTGNTFTAQKVVTVKLAPASQPASAPASHRNPGTPYRFFRWEGDSLAQAKGLSQELVWCPRICAGFAVNRSHEHGSSWDWRNA